MSMLTQGTQVYALVPTVADPAVFEILNVECATAFNPGGSPAEQIEDTCLDNTTDKTFKPGLGNPGQVTVPFNFIPSHTSHQILFELKELGTVLQWMECFSEAQTPPTLDSNDELVAPAGRTTAEFQAYIADVNIDVATNEIVRGTLLLQRSGAVEWHWNGPTP